MIANSRIIPPFMILITLILSNTATVNSMGKKGYGRGYGYGKQDNNYRKNDKYQDKKDKYNNIPPSASSAVVETAPTIQATTIDARTTATPTTAIPTVMVATTPNSAPVYVAPVWESPVYYSPVYGNSCRVCEDKRPSQMIQNGNYCSTLDPTILRRRCNTWQWRKRKYCRLSCYLADRGHYGDKCCVDTSAPVIPPTLSPVPPPPSDAPPTLLPSDAPSTPPPLSSPPTTSAPISLLTYAPASAEIPVAPITDATITPTTDSPAAPPTDAPVVPPSDAPVSPQLPDLSQLIPVSQEEIAAPSLEVVQIDTLQPSQLIALTSPEIPTGIAMDAPTAMTGALTEGTTAAPIQAIYTTAAPVMLPLESMRPFETQYTGGVKMVSLPKMQFRLSGIVGFVTEDHFRLGLADFIEKTVKANAKILGDVVYIDLDVSILDDERKRMLGEELTVLVEGDSYFGGDIYPTTDRMTEVLNAYFANWGNADLRDHLTSDQVRVRNIDIILDDELVEKVHFQQQPQTSEIEESNNSNNEVLSRNQQDEEVPTWVLIVGLILGCIALGVAVSLVYWQRKTSHMDQRSHQQRGRPPKIISPATSPSKSSHDMEEADIIIPELPEDASFSGVSMSGLSMEDSIYTSGGISRVSSSHNVAVDLSFEESSCGDQYNTKRLEKVIANAQEFVVTHRGDENNNNKMEPSAKDIALKTSKEEPWDCIQ